MPDALPELRKEFMDSLCAAMRVLIMSYGATQAEADARVRRFRLSIDDPIANRPAAGAKRPWDL